MTVEELIKRLSEYPKDTRVVVRGYEDGVDDVKEIVPVTIELNYFEKDYYGKHVIVGKRHTVEGETAKVVHLSASDT